MAGGSKLVGTGIYLFRGKDEKSWFTFFGKLFCQYLLSFAQKYGDENADFCIRHVQIFTKF